ncbi:hypothetical protein SNE40_021709 [Patella caerulea]|uniref:Uncharacterized protein n=1 Tax=Patella caerulea TaxID=87958 RepID=A0AAN8J0P6_PATCE
MKAVLVLLVISIVAAYAVDVDLDFIKSALAFKNHVMKRDAEQSLGKRKMLGFHWLEDKGGKCSEENEVCNMFQDCCYGDVDLRCNHFLGGTCVPRT